jgi:CspA family cold shock protein
MATGKVLQFDPGRGYGFVAADDGGEDIFLHASVFDGDPGELVPGAPLEFQVMAGDRGRKAFAAHFAGKIPATMPPPVMSAQALAVVEAEEEQLCDVLSHGEFASELTEMLLRTIPALTGAQILEIRQNLFEFARKHSWVDV